MSNSTVLPRAEIVGYVTAAELLDRIEAGEVENANSYYSGTSLEDVAEKLTVCKDAEIPVLRNIDSLVLESVQAEGCRLDMTDWHGEDNELCGTTHCRAGWVTHHIRDSEFARHYSKWDPGFIGAAVYAASTGRIPNFYCTNAEAMDDLRRCAAAEQAEAVQS